MKLKPSWVPSMQLSCQITKQAYSTAADDHKNLNPMILAGVST